MNKKQLIAMWCGIVAFAFLGVIWSPSCYWRIQATIADIVELLARWLVVVVITGGFIITFKGKEDMNVIMNWKRGFDRLTWVLSVLGFLSVAGFGFFCYLTEYEPGFGFFYYLMLPPHDTEPWVLWADSILLGGITFLAVWAVYYTVRYIVRGFCDKPKDKKNNK